MGIDDKLDNKVDQAKGRGEQAVGELTDDEELKARGERHEAGGKLKEKVTDVSDKIGEKIDDAQEKLDSKSR